MKAIVTVVEKISSEAHIDIPEGLAELGIRQHVVDHYKSGEMLPLLNIFHVDFESMSVHIGKKLQITWQPGKPWSSKRPYYFCKLGRFTLTLLTDTEQNLTRTEVYFGHHKQLIYTSEKEISKELATVVVEKLCPDMTKLEMFARSSRVDWDCWGDQADLFDQLNAEIDNDTSLSA